MEKQAPRVAVIGCGYWGQNLVRNFFELGALEWACDTNLEALAQMESKYRIRTTASFEDVLNDPGVSGVVIAVPAVDHFRVASAALRAGKDVFVEKPLALHVQDGETLVEAARAANRILMVGHLLLYHPAVLKLKQLVQEGELGHIKYVYSSRLNIGKLRTEENILWSFAPHDISAILYLLEETPDRITSTGGIYLDSHTVDTTLTTCEFPSGVNAHIFVSWLHPFKEQKLAIVGGKKMAVFDDLERERKLVLYSHRIDWVNRTPVVHKELGEPVPLPDEEPLRRECEHFLECILDRRVPRSDGTNGVQVLRILEACGRSVANRGLPVDCKAGVENYFMHPTAVIDPGCDIGAGTKIWHFSHVMPGSKIGQNCNLGQNVVVSPDVKIGNNVKIQNNVSVYTGVELEDNVFCGPSMVFTNVLNPRSHVIRRHEYRKTLVREGASIGANATIVCGVTLGKFCFIGAGAVVTRDVPDYALMVGAPARQIGYMCNCGIRLVESVEPTCTACGRTYKFAGTSLVEAEKRAVAVTAA